MTARIHLLPVIRIEHDRESSLREADDLSNVVRLDRYRRKQPRRYLLAEPSSIGPCGLGESFALLWLQGLETAAMLGIAPWWVP